MHRTHTPKPRDQALVWRETAKELPDHDQTILAQFPDGSIEVVIVDALDKNGVPVMDGDCKPASIDRMRVSPSERRGDGFDCAPDWWAALEPDDIEDAQIGN